MSLSAKAPTIPAKRLPRVFAGALAVGIASSIGITVNPAPAQADEIGGWELDALNVHDAWDTTQGEGATIAILDTGVGEHPFFDDKDVQPGFSRYEDENDGREDESGHGTAVAGAALSVAPEATLMPIKHFLGVAELPGQEDTAVGSSPSADESIVWAVDNGADVIVFPWIRSGDEPIEKQALQYAVDNDVILVAGAGNDPDDRIWWPAAYEGVMVVSGTDENNELYVDSTTGDEVTVAAPATDITSAEIPRGLDAEPSYEESWGTSMSSGLAGGVAALVLAGDSDVDSNNAIARMIETANDLGDSGWDPEFGHGLLDAAAAVNSDITDYDENPLGYPLGEPGASEDFDLNEPAEEDDNGEGSDTGTTETALANDESILGLPPLLFWGLVGFIILDIILVTGYLVYRNKKNNQPTPMTWHQPTHGQPPTY